MVGGIEIFREEKKGIRQALVEETEEATGCDAANIQRYLNRNKKSAFYVRIKR